MIYRPIDIQLMLTPEEAQKLLSKVRNYPDLTNALEDAIAHCERWGTYPKPYRAQVIGFQREQFEGLTGPEPHSATPDPLAKWRQGEIKTGEE